MAGSSLLPSLAALAADHAAESPVDVAARGSKEMLEAVAEEDLLPAAREFRAAMRRELLENQRHLQASRDTLLRATLLDPRYKHAASSVAPFATEAERDAAVEALLREAGDLLRGREGPEPPLIVFGGSLWPPASFRGLGKQFYHPIGRAEVCPAHAVPSWSPWRCEDRRARKRPSEGCGGEAPTPWG